MNGRDIIVEALGPLMITDDTAGALIDALAQAGFLGMLPDGTVGRLDVVPFYAEHYGHRWASDAACDHCGMARRVSHQADPTPCPKNLVPLYRVVTP